MTHPVPAPTRVLYVGGMPRSGSTLLTWMLGQLPGHCAVGELFYLWTSGLERDQLCGCGEAFRSCEFWTDVGERAFGGWSAVDVERVRTLMRRVDATTQIPRVLGSRFLPTFRREQQEYADLLARVYGAASHVSGCPTVVDGSKRPSLAYLLRTAPQVDLRVVQIVRDPHGVAHSWSKQVTLPPGAGAREYLKVRPTRLITRRWITVNALIRGIRRLSVPVLTVRYEDLVAEPRATMASIAAFSGAHQVNGSDPVHFVRSDGVHLAPAHMVEGGRVRFSPSPLTLRLDESWRLEMPAPRRRAVSLTTAVARRRYGYR